MFYGLATNKIRVPGLKFNHTLTDIETLNRKAMEGFYDVTAISFHAYPYIQDIYGLMSCGGSVGDKYGPMVVAPRARPGNWLPTGGVEKYQLLLRLYDTPVGMATRSGREAPMPNISRRGCQ